MSPSEDTYSNMKMKRLVCLLFWNRNITEVIRKFSNQHFGVYLKYGISTVKEIFSLIVAG